MAFQVYNNSKYFENCDFTDPQHCSRLCDLVNAYITDPKGGGTPLTDRQKLHLLDGLETNPNAIVLFIVQEEEIIGYAVAFISFSTFLAGRVMNIHDLFIEEEYRGKKKGKMLLRKLIEIAGQINCRKMTLEVRKDNEVAQILYFSEGFSPTTPEMYFWARRLD